MLNSIVQVERNHVSSTKLQRLQDEIDELKVERDGLAKKANTVDKYKQKLQARQNVEKDNELLRAEIEDIRQNAENTADSQEQFNSLQQTIDEYKGILPRIEQDRHELQMMKSQLEIDNATLAERWEAANEQRTRDQETIEELQLEIQNARSRTSPSSSAPRDLEAELAGTTENEPKLQVAGLALIFSRYLNKSRKTRISELESEITQLKTDSPATDDQSAMLQQQLDDIYKKHDTLEKRYQATWGKKLSLGSALQAVQAGASVESGPIADEIRDLLNGGDSLEDMNSLQGQLVQTKGQLARTQAELASSSYKLDDSYNRRKSLEALHLKVVQEHVNQYAALHELEDKTNKTNRVLQQKANSLEHELKVQKDLLRDARAADKKMPKTAETSPESLRKTLETLELIKSAARKGSQGPAPGSTAHLEQLMANCADEIISGNEALAKKTEVHKTLSLEPSDKTELPQTPPPLAVSQHGSGAPALSASQKWSSKFGWGR